MTLLRAFSLSSSEPADERLARCRKEAGEALALFESFSASEEQERRWAACGLTRGIKAASVAAALSGKPEDQERLRRLRRARSNL